MNALPARIFATLCVVFTGTFGRTEAGDDLRYAAITRIELHGSIVAGCVIEGWATPDKVSLNEAVCVRRGSSYSVGGYASFMPKRSPGEIFAVLVADIKSARALDVAQPPLPQGSPNAPTGSVTIRRGSSSQTLTARTTPDVAPGSRESVIAGLFRRLLNDLQDRMRPYMVI